MRVPGQDAGRDSRKAVRWIARAAVVVLVGVAIWLARRDPDIQVPQTVVLYGFTAMTEALQEAVLPGFQKQWAEATGRRVEFVATYAGSGVITRDIIDRIPVELAILSSEIDLLRLAERGIVPARGVKLLPQQGVVTRSPMVILVRAGNPRHITGFADLLRDGVEVVQCDPLTSGAGEWSLLSFYAALRLTEGDEQARARLDELRDHIVATETSARAALLAFTTGGKGDALVTYESEWLGLDPERRELLDIVYPATTLDSEHLVLRLDRNIQPDKRDLIDALVEYLWSAEAQASFQAYGFARSDPRATPISGPVRLLTLDDLGGAQAAARTVLDPWLRRAQSSSGGLRPRNVHSRATS